jgi:hypothetical protein
VPNFRVWRLGFLASRFATFSSLCGGGAGTDANVSVVLYGDKGDSGTRLLDNSANNFEVTHFDSLPAFGLRECRLLLTALCLRLSFLSLLPPAATVYCSAPPWTSSTSSATTSVWSTAFRCALPAARYTANTTSAQECRSLVLVARTEGYTYAANVWDVHRSRTSFCRPVPNPNVRFATVPSLYTPRLALSTVDLHAELQGGGGVQNVRKGTKAEGDERTEETKKSPENLISSTCPQGSYPAAAAFITGSGIPDACA